MQNEVSRPGAGRVAFLDAIRGYALLVIPVNHIWYAALAAGISTWHVPTPSLLGFSSAAELLVFTAGYAFVLANRRRLANRGLAGVQVHALRRGLRLLAVNTAMLAATCALIGLLDFVPRAQPKLIWQVLLGTPGDWFVTFRLAFARLPDLYTFNVLPLYAVLLLAAPVALVGINRHPRLVIGGSAVLYTLATTGPLGHAALNLGADSFNPLAWQGLFVLGMLAARARWFLQKPPRWVWPGVLAISVIGLGWALTHRYPVNISWLQLVPDLPTTTQSDIGLLPILHMLAVLATASWAYHALPVGIAGLLERGLGAVGRHSLSIYVIGNLLQFATVPVLAQFSSSALASLSAAVFVVVALMAFAQHDNARLRSMLASWAERARGCGAGIA